MSLSFPCAPQSPSARKPHNKNRNRNGGENNTIIRSRKHKIPKVTSLIVTSAFPKMWMPLIYFLCGLFAFGICLFIRLQHHVVHAQCTHTQTHPTPHSHSMTFADGPNGDGDGDEDSERGWRTLFHLYLQWLRRTARTIKKSYATWHSALNGVCVCGL